MKLARHVAICVLALAISASASFGQDVVPQPAKSVPEPVLVDEYGQLSHCDFTARLDSFMAELSEKPGYHGYVLNYKSTDELPGDRDRYYREDWMAHHILFRNFDRSRITLVRRGYFTEIRTQLWMVPPGGKVPDGLTPIPAPEIPEKKTFLFERNSLTSDKVEPTYELGDWPDEQLPDFVLESVKAREQAEQEEREKAYAEEDAEAEQTDAGTTETTPPTSHEGHEAGTESSHTDHEAATEMSQEEHDASPVEDIEVWVDKRTPEQREEDRYSWAETGLARLIASRKGSSGVIIVYADDQRYDMAKLKQFVSQGRDRLARRASIPPSRLKIIFGGYRSNPEVEFWFVRPKGKTPFPTPEERPVEEPEVATEN